MKKALSSMLIALMVILNGCSETPKNDEKLIAEAFESIKEKKTDMVYSVDTNQAIEEIKKVGMRDNVGFLRIGKIKAGVFSECTAVGVNSIKGDWAHVSKSCENIDAMGDFYMKKVDGVWKIPVKEE